MIIICVLVIFIAFSARVFSFRTFVGVIDIHQSSLSTFWVCQYSESLNSGSPALRVRLIIFGLTITHVQLVLALIGLLLMGIIIDLGEFVRLIERPIVLLHSAF